MSQMALFLSVKVDVSYKEGADNIDINTEKIDGKDTFHSMARAVFQALPITYRLMYATGVYQKEQR